MTTFDEVWTRILNASPFFDCKERYAGHEVGIFKDDVGYFGVSVDTLNRDDRLHIYLELSAEEVGTILLNNQFSPSTGLCAKYVMKAFENIIAEREFCNEP